MKLWLKVVISSAIAIVVWIIAWLAIFLFAQLIPDGSAEKLGQVGDMFGAGNALFSGIAVAAVAIVLTFDMTERSRDLSHREKELVESQHRLRPFVVPQVQERDGCSLGEPKRNSSGTLSLVVTVKAELRNETADVALNVWTRVLVRDFPDVFTSLSWSLPLVQNSPGRIELTGVFNGADAERFAVMVRDHGLQLLIESEYSSLNGTLWRSSSSVDLRARQKQVRSLVDEALASEPGWGTEDDGGMAGGTIYPLAASVEPDSWRQDAIAVRTIR